MKILLVDDDEIILDIIKTFIERFGFECITASDGLDGMKKFKENKDNIFMVFTDQTMPNMSGEQLVKFIKESNPNVSVVMMTGYSGMYDKKDLMSVDDILLKPITFNVLKICIRKIVKKQDILLPQPDNYSGEVETLDSIIERLTKTRNRKKTDKFNIYKFKKEINYIISNILNEILLLESAFISLKPKIPPKKVNLNSSFIKLINLIQYCRCLVVLYNNVFCKNKYCISNSGIDEVIKNVITILGFNNIKLAAKKTITAETDRQLLEACLFFIILNINDFVGKRTQSIEVNYDLDSNKLPYICFEFSTAPFIKEKKGIQKIAIIDDDPSYSQFLNRILKNNNYDVYLYNSGYDFFDLFEEEIGSDPDLIVLDVQMKGMPGTEVLKSFRSMRRYSHIPILIVSGNPQVQSAKFQTLIEDYSPVRGFYKEPALQNELIKCINEELSKEYSYFKFSDLFSMSLENSIISDNLLALGMNPVQNILNQLGIKIEINEDKQNHLLTLQFIEKSDIIEKDNGSECFITRYSFEKMNEYVRHELKNKLGSLSHLINEINEEIENNKKLNKNIKIPYNHDQVTKIFNFLEDIKNIK